MKTEIAEAPPVKHDNPRMYVLRGFSRQHLEDSALNMIRGAHNSHLVRQTRVLSASTFASNNVILRCYLTVKDVS